MNKDRVPYTPGMTLMPGQSTSVGIPIPPALGEAMAAGEFRLVEVPPPKNAPVQDIAETLGLVAGLRAERSGHGQWRCAWCSTMQQGGGWRIWVPDGVRRGDPDWSVTEACRQNAWNGHHSAWCLSCAPKAPKKAKAGQNSIAATQAKPRKRFLGIF